MSFCAWPDTVFSPTFSTRRWVPGDWCTTHPPRMSLRVFVLPEGSERSTSIGPLGVYFTGIDSPVMAAVLIWGGGAGGLVVVGGGE